MNITISIPEIADIPAIVAWSGEREMLGSDRDKPHSPEVLEEWIKNPGQDIILIAKVGKTPVGMCTVDWMRDWAYCSELYVAKEYRRKGVGKALIADVMKRLKGRTGYLGLVVDEDNTASKQFYKSMGFNEGFLFRWMDKRMK